MTNATFIDPTRADIDILLRAQQLCDPILRRAVISLPDSLEIMGGYHFGWWDAQRQETSSTPGKFLRAALVFGAAAACGGSAEMAGPAAAAVELLHNFTLIHDDVMDGDRTRRGRPTIWAKWGINNAILLGDAFHSLAIRLLAQSAPQGHSSALESVVRLEQTCLQLCGGQFQDCAYESSVTVGLPEYLEMAGAKTAALMGCACALGAASAAAHDTTVSAIERFGYELGLAFQAVDDIIGIWGQPGRTGKPVGSDLARRKSTLPVILALNSQCDASAELSKIYRAEYPMTESEILRATELLEQAGARRAAERYAEDRITAAILLLPEGSTAAELVTLARLVTTRSR
jgi:geranylgeranyl diphosphate synthase type I